MAGLLDRLRHVFHTGLFRLLGDPILLAIQGKRTPFLRWPSESQRQCFRLHSSCTCICRRSTAPRWCTRASSTLCVRSSSPTFNQLMRGRRSDEGPYFYLEVLRVVALHDLLCDISLTQWFRFVFWRTFFIRVRIFSFIETNKVTVTVVFWCHRIGLLKEPNISVNIRTQWDIAWSWY